MLCRLTMNSSQNSTGGGKRRRSVWARRLNILGIVLIFGALVVVSMRSFVVESFNDARHKSFMAPAGKMFAPDAGHFYFAVVSDTGARNEPVEKIMNEIRKSKARFVLYVGDLVRYRNPSHFQWMAEEIDEKLGKTPLYAVPGNHEILSVNGVVDRSLYNEVFGPGYYWFSYGEVLFVGLDSSTSAYDDEQLQWLDKTLAKIRPQFKYCVIFSHVPPVNVKVPNDHRLFDESRDRFAEVIRNRGVNLLISGHVHYYSESEFAGVPLITLPSSGQPIRSEIKKFGYVMFKADRDGIAKIKPVYVEAGDDMEHWEAFMSSALVDEDINFFSVWVFCAGVVLLFGGKILRL